MEPRAPGSEELTELEDGLESLLARLWFALAQLEAVKSAQASGVARTLSSAIPAADSALRTVRGFDTARQPGPGSLGLTSDRSAH